jgi:hypothetical protein
VTATEYALAHARYLLQVHKCAHAAELRQALGEMVEAWDRRDRDEGTLADLAVHYGLLPPQPRERRLHAVKGEKR